MIIKKGRISFWGVLFFILSLTACKSPQFVTNNKTRNLEKTHRIEEWYKNIPRSVYGVSRQQEYVIEHTDIPKDFDGVTILWISDLHYPSYFKTEHLEGLCNYLDTLSYDICCLGGDFHEDERLINPLFEKLSKSFRDRPVYAVLGNNDYERAYDELIKALDKSKISILEHKVDTIYRGDSFIQIAGVRNPFDLKLNGESPSLPLSDNDFVILLTHTPDYAEDVSIKNSDIVLAGHTHGGQIVLLGHAPVVPSRYDQRFLKGLVYNSEGIPLIVTRGIGTSQRNIRIGAPSEVVLIHLKSPN